MILGVESRGPDNSREPSPGGKTKFKSLYFPCPRGGRDVKLLLGSDTCVFLSFLFETESITVFPFSSSYIRCYLFKTQSIY
jgi:hypothetical protein